MLVRLTDIPPVATVEEGEVFRVDCVDWTGGQIKNDDNSDDVKNVDLSQVHYLSGPISVKNAEPGDLLKVEFLDLGPLNGDEWGFTGTFAKENGGGFYPVQTFTMMFTSLIYSLLKTIGNSQDLHSLEAAVLVATNKIWRLRKWQEQGQPEDDKNLLDEMVEIIKLSDGDKEAEKK